MTPSSNWDTGVARAFHAATKYHAGPGRILMGDGEDAIWQQDLSIEPLVSKFYEDLTPIRLRTEMEPTTLPALEALRRTGREGESHPSLAALARLSLLSNGRLNRQQRRRTGTIAEFRTAGATGARYHLELYFICQDLAYLGGGVYHYTTDDHSLRQLRAGDYRAAIVEASGNQAALAAAPVILMLTSTFWRNAWRYKARAYRHAFWDAGTLLANFLAVAASLNLPTRLVLGFVDADVNRVIGASTVSAKQR
jgi:SagB-type dehydrogenase family enzyme